MLYKLLIEDESGTQLSVGTFTLAQLRGLYPEPEEAHVTPEEPLDDTPTGVVLDYSHISQNGFGADANRNDCGPAVLVSILREHGYPRIVVDEVANRFMDYKSQPLDLIKMQRALRVYKVTHRYVSNIKTDEIVDAILEGGRPVVVLVSYEHLPYHPVKYTGGHYILVYGYDAALNKFYYHDPLANGVNRTTITPYELNNAMWQNRHHGNQPYQAIIIE